MKYSDVILFYFIALVCIGKSTAGVIWCIIFCLWAVQPWLPLGQTSGLVYCGTQVTVIYHCRIHSQSERLRIPEGFQVMKNDTQS